MAVRNAVFVDLSSMNVLFKLDTKFVAVLNYSSGLERLGECLPALGPGYDIYLCLKPRAPGEGELVIDELSLSGLPFTADPEELYQVLKFFHDSNGVSDVYICNWIANYIAMARVATFKSTFYYGDRVAYIEVKDRVLENFKLFPSQLAFACAYGDDYNGYGDLGLLDVDGLKAQYPEFAEGSKAQLTAVAPLTQCYKTPMKINSEELYSQLREKYQRGYVVPEKVAEVEGLASPPKVEDPQLLPVSEEIPDPPEEAKPREVEEDCHLREPRVKRPPTPVMVKVLVVLCVLMSFTTGAVARMALADTTGDSHQVYFDEADARIAGLQELSKVYSGAYELTKKAASALEYCKKNELGVTIVGFEHSAENTVIRCVCASQDVVTTFEGYISEKYFVVSTNDLGMSDVDGKMVYQFSIMFS